MLAAYCSRHGATLLYSASSFVELRRTDAGLEVTIECDCGAQIQVCPARGGARPLAATAV